MEARRKGSSSGWSEARHAGERRRSNAVKTLERLKLRASALKRELAAISYASRDPRLPLPPKILIVLALCYALSPVDLIPDFIPILGLLDDLLIVPALISLSIKLVPKSVMEEARRRAEREPLELKKNWRYAIVFILFWTVLLAAVLARIVRL
jgi:uncharacterized membrane protein YkvA (DUF1232 family)